MNNTTTAYIVVDDCLITTVESVVFLYLPSCCCKQWWNTVACVLAIAHKQQYFVSEQFEVIKKEGGRGCWSCTSMKSSEVSKKKISYLLTNPEKPQNEYFHFLGFRAPGSAQELRKSLFLIFPKKSFSQRWETSSKLLEVCFFLQNVNKTDVD